MDSKETQQVLDELEPRIERLKSLYQQYFMGIEKIPPLVLRKDVDRTIWRLRRERFQSTRLRFKFQQIIQRYNTYQQYWARILRDIERGTYKRDIVRAAKRFGEDDAMADAGSAARAALRRQMLDEDEAPEVPTWTLDAEALDEDDDLDAITPPLGRSFEPAHPVARPAPAARPAPKVWDLSEPEPPEPPARPNGAHAPAAAAARPPTAQRSGMAQPAMAQPSVAQSSTALPPGAPPPPRRGAPAPRPREPVPEPTPSATKRAALFGRRPKMPNRPPPPAPGGTPKDQPPPTAQPSAAKSTTPDRASPTPAAPTPARAPRTPPGAAPPAPVRSPGPPPRAPAPSAPERPAARPSDRTRQIYDEYVRARQATGEKVGNITYDALQRSLQQQTERLRRQHGNREVDYEVVTKNGRTLIRPVIK